MKNGCFFSILFIALVCGCSKNNNTISENPQLTGNWKLQTAIASTYGKNGVFKATDTIFTTKPNQDTFIAFAGDGTFEEYVLSNAVKTNSQKGTYIFDSSAHSLTETLATTGNNPVNDTPGRVRGKSSGNTDVLLSKVKFTTANQMSIIYTYYVVTYGPYSGGVSTISTDSVVQINTLIKQ
jgi:hypothetical protein